MTPSKTPSASPDTCNPTCVHSLNNTNYIRDHQKWSYALFST